MQHRSLGREGMCWSSSGRGESGAVTEQSTAEDAEKPRKREEGSTECQEGLERLGSVGKRGTGVWGEQLGGKPDAFPKLGSERASSPPWGELIPGSCPKSRAPKP